MVDAKRADFGHLMETCTFLVRIQTCGSTKPQEKGVHLLTTFQVGNAQSGRGPGQG